MKTNKLLISIIILLLFTNFLTHSKLRNLENKVSNLNNSVVRLDNRIGNISGDVSRVLDNFMAENAWTRKVRAQAVRYNEEEMTAGVDIEVEFNELRNDEKIYIVVQDTEGAYQDKIDATEAMNSSLNLDYSLELAIGRDYVLSIVGESAESKRSESLGDVRLNYMMKEILFVDGYIWGVEVDEKNTYKSVGMDIMINSNFDKDPFIADYFRNRKIVDVRGEIYADDVLVDTIEFLQDENWYISGQDPSEEPLEEDYVMPVFEFGIESMLQLDINGEYIFNKPVTKNQMMEMLVVFTDNQGDEYRYQLYHIFE